VEITTPDSHALPAIPKEYKNNRFGQFISPKAALILHLRWYDARHAAHCASPIAAFVSIITIHQTISRQLHTITTS
jgi:hypothetical protein